MPTNDERREAACMLRTIKRGDIEYPWGNPICEISACVDGGCICGEDCHGDYDPDCALNIINRLANLIEPEPERICTNCGDKGYFRCSKCGCELQLVKDNWHALYMGEMNYCPNCRARVVNNDDE